MLPQAVSLRSKTEMKRTTAIPDTTSAQSYLNILKREAAVLLFRRTLLSYYRSDVFKIEPDLPDPFPVPPFLLRKFCNFSLALVDDGRKILTWEVDKPGGLLCYDFTAKRRWTKVSTPLADQLPLINFCGKRPFFIDDNDPEIGNFHLLFSYDPLTDPLIVSAYFVSNKLDNFVHNKPVPVPELCCEYFTSKCDSDSKSSGFEFVYLGERKFGLVLHKYCQDKSAGNILVLVYEYDITTPTSEIQTRLLMTRRFRYPVTLLQERGPEYSPAYAQHAERYGEKLEESNLTTQVHLEAAYMV